MFQTFYVIVPIPELGLVGSWTEYQVIKKEEKSVLNQADFKGGGGLKLKAGNLSTKKNVIYLESNHNQL